MGMQFAKLAGCLLGHLVQALVATAEDRRLLMGVSFGF